MQNSNIKTSASQNFKLVTRVAKNKTLWYKIDIFCLRNKDKGLPKSLTKPHQYLGCLQLCFKIYHYRRTSFLFDISQSSESASDCVQYKAYKICLSSVAIVEWFACSKTFIKKPYKPEQFRPRGSKQKRNGKRNLVRNCHEYFCCKKWKHQKPKDQMTIKADNQSNIVTERPAESNYRK